MTFVTQGDSSEINHVQQHYLTPAQAAQYLGVHKNTIWKLIREGSLPASRIGPRIVRIAKSDVENLMKKYVGGEFGRWSR